jgi:hypothetical protein
VNSEKRDGRSVISSAASGFVSASEIVRSAMAEKMRKAAKSDKVKRIDEGVTLDQNCLVSLGFGFHREFFEYVGLGQLNGQIHDQATAHANAQHNHNEDTDESVQFRESSLARNGWRWAGSLLRLSPHFYEKHKKSITLDSSPHDNWLFNRRVCR